MEDRNEFDAHFPMLVMGPAGRVQRLRRTAAPPTQSVGRFRGVLAYTAKGQTAAQQTTDETSATTGRRRSRATTEGAAARCSPAQAAHGRKVGTTARGRGAYAEQPQALSSAKVADTMPARAPRVGATVGVVAGGRQARKAQEQQKRRRRSRAGERRTGQGITACAADTFRKGMSACSNRGLHGQVALRVPAVQAGSWDKGPRTRARYRLSPACD
jgi:hypothetical protein